MNFEQWQADGCEKVFNFATTDGREGWVCPEEKGAVKVWKVLVSGRNLSWAEVLLPRGEYRSKRIAVEKALSIVPRDLDIDQHGRFGHFFKCA